MLLGACMCGCLDEPTCEDGEYRDLTWGTASQAAGVDLSTLIDQLDGRYTLRLGPALLGAERPGGYGFPLTLDASARLDEDPRQYLPPSERGGSCGGFLELPSEMQMRADTTEPPWRLVSVDMTYYDHLYVEVVLEVETDGGVTVLRGTMGLSDSGVHLRQMVFFTDPHAPYEAPVGELLSDEQCAPIPVEEC